MLVPQDPKHQEREVKAEAKDYGNAKPIRERLAAVFVAIGGICGLILSWALATSHQTTAKAAIVVGILSFTLAACFHWVPHNNKDEDDEKKLDSGLVRLGLTMPAPSLLAHEVRKTTIPESFEPLKPSTDPRTNIVHTPLEAGYGMLWTEYTEDVFDNIIWRWKYNAHIDQTPRNLHAYCIECQQLMSQTSIFHGTSLHPGYFVQVTCRQHTFDHVPTNSSGDFIGIKERIQKKLQDGSWVEVVNKQRVARHQEPLALPSTLPAAVPDPLPEISILILRILAINGGSCDKNTFYNTLHHLCYLEKKPPPDGVSIQFHLHELEEKQKYISVERGVYSQHIGSLTQPGRKYVIDHELIDERADRLEPEGAEQRERAASAENAELTIAHIAKRLEHRRIEPSLLEKALRVLQSRPKGSVEIVHLANDHEAWILAIDFVHLMNKAGWNVFDDSPKGLATILDLGAAPFGMTVQARVIDADLGDPSLFDALVDAVAAAGFSSAGGISADLPNDCCRLIVGPRL